MVERKGSGGLNVGHEVQEKQDGRPFGDDAGGRPRHIWHFGMMKFSLV